MRTVSCKPNDGQLSTVKDDTALQEWTVDSVSCSSCVPSPPKHAG